MTSKLAAEGGSPVRATPMPPWPQPGEDQIAAAERVVRSGKLGYWVGEEGRSLEREYAASLGCAHGVAVANGTLALELALRAFSIGPGDEVVVPSRSFVATASCIVAVGAIPVFADIDTTSNALTAETVSAVLTGRTAAVIPVHVGGWPADMDPIMALAEERGLIVIEDCAQAHGARYHGRPIGSIGHAAAFSFCQDKIMSTGEGGLFTTDGEAAYTRAWEYKDHGKSLAKLTDPAFPSATSGFKWLHDSFGSNWRMPEVQAAMAREQLHELAAWHAQRTRNALRLAEAIADAPGLHVPLPPPGVDSAFYRLYGRVDLEALAPGWTRDRVIEAISAEGTPCQYGSCAEMYREEAFVSAGLGPAGRLPAAGLVHETSIAFFVHPTLHAPDIDDTAEAVRKVLTAACR